MSREGFVSNYLLEKYALNEMNERERVAFENKFESPEKLEKLVNEINEQNLEFMWDVSINREVNSIKNKYEMKKLEIDYEKQQKLIHNPRFLSIFSLAMLLFIIAMVFVFSDVKMANFDSNEPSILTRGNPYIVIYKKTDTGIQILHNDEYIKEDDVVQIEYNKYSNPYGMIFSIDGNRNFTLHYPKYIDGSTLLGDKNINLLDYAYKFDNAPKFERFFFVSSNKAFKVKDLIANIKNFAKYTANIKEDKIKLPKDFTEYSITLNKED